MTDFRTIEDYRIHIKDLSYADLKGIERKIDKEKYTERYDLVCRMIINKEIAGDTDTKKESIYYPPGVIIIRNAHIIIMIFGCINLIIQLLSRSKIADTLDIFYNTQGIIISGLVVCGIYYVKQWVVLLITINAYVTFTGKFIHMLYYTRSNVAETDYIMINMLFVLFLFYQIFVFSKNDTKYYFKARDNIIL